MVITASNGGFTTTPNHRQNRRRERPGSRTRRTITRKAAMQTEFSEGLLDAFDLDVRLPSDRSNPSPLLRQNFDNAWQKWKVREEEQKIEREEREREMEAELEREQLRLFGGEVDDDELRRLGILYDADGLDSQRPSLSHSSSWANSVPKSAPLYTIRQVKSRRLKRRPIWRALPLNLSLSNLRDDYDLARLLAPVAASQSIVVQIQPEHVEPPTSRIVPDEHLSSPQSLPKSSASLSPALVSSPTTSASAPASASIAVPVNESLISSPQLSSPFILPHSLTHEDWTFITSPSSSQLQPLEQQFTHPSLVSTPFSEPETWILLGDDL